MARAFAACFLCPLLLCAPPLAAQNPRVVEVANFQSIRPGQAPVPAPQQAPQVGLMLPPLSVAAHPRPVSLGELEQLALAYNPTIAQANALIEVARGSVIQSHLYPNPVFSVTGDELGSPRGPGGFITGPTVTQEFVVPGKRKLDKAVAGREVEKVSRGLLRQQFVVLTAVRQDYYEVLTTRRRVQVLRELVRIATQAHDVSKQQVEAKQAAKLDLLQLRINLNRIRGEMYDALQDQTTAWRKLAADVGKPDLPESQVLGDLEAALPRYQYEATLAQVLHAHPEVQAAQVAAEQAELTLQRAQIEAIPNVTGGVGYSRTNVDREDVWNFMVSVPIPLFNRNQGRIHAAQAEGSRLVQEVTRVQNDLAKRVAEAFDRYAPASQRAELYRTSILPDAREAQQIALAGFKGGEFEYLKVLEAQKALEEANLEYLKLLGEAWYSACEIAGLLLEQRWPCPSVMQAP